MGSSTKKRSAGSWGDSFKVVTFRVSDSHGLVGSHHPLLWSPINPMTPLPEKHCIILVDRWSWIIDTNIKLIHCINNNDTIPKRTKRESK